MTIESLGLNARETAPIGETQGHEVANQIAPSPTHRDQQHIEADTVHLTGNVNQVEARQINVDRGNIGQVRGETMTVRVTRGGVGAVAAKQLDLTLHKSGVGALVAQQAEVHDGQVSALLANRVCLDGNARVFIDLRAGVLFGVIVGALIGVSNLIIKWRTQRVSTLMPR